MEEKEEREMIEKKDVVEMEGGERMIEWEVKDEKYKRNDVMEVKGVGVDKIWLKEKRIEKVNVGK